MRKQTIPVLIVTGTMLMAMACTPPSTGVHRGEALYGKCVNCHGEAGEGRKQILAPAIAGLPDWYVVEQLKKFKEGIRGSAFKDVAGHRMRPMGRMLKTEEDMKAVAVYVQGLKQADSPTSVDGDAYAGKAQYTACLACHGPEGKGNEQLGAPDIRYTGDWYLLEQLKKFKSGWRGADPRDVRGATMRPNAMAMNEQQMKDVVAYIMTLKQ